MGHAALFARALSYAVGAGLPTCSEPAARDKSELLPVRLVERFCKVATCASLPCRDRAMLESSPMLSRPPILGLSRYSIAPARPVKHRHRTPQSCKKSGRAPRSSDLPFPLSRVASD